MNYNHTQLARLCAALLCVASLHACEQAEPAQQGATPPAKKAQLPPQITDHVAYYQGKQVPIEMLLVPGDETKGIKPFYMGKTEVTWAMMHRWMYGEDVFAEKNRHRNNYKHYAKLIDQGLRPSPMYEEHPGLAMGRRETHWEQRPAAGVSWLTAQSFCIWLSEQTGRQYRLPTDAEWQHALRLGGGVPAKRSALLNQAVLKDNAPEDVAFFFPIGERVASKAPNELGLYDLLGNMAEWIQPTGNARYVRGASYTVKADDVAATWRADENQDVWNEHYPNIPASRFWYIDRIDVGLRLVCEVEE